MSGHRVSQATIEAWPITACINGRRYILLPDDLDGWVAVREKDSRRPWSRYRVSRGGLVSELRDAIAQAIQGAREIAHRAPAEMDYAAADAVLGLVAERIASEREHWGALVGSTAKRERKAALADTQAAIERVPASHAIGGNPRFGGEVKAEALAVVRRLAEEEQ